MIQFFGTTISLPLRIATSLMEFLAPTATFLRLTLRLLVAGPAQRQQVKAGQQLACLWVN